MVPRTGPLSASSALLIRSWYQRGKSSARGVRTGAFAMARWYGHMLPVCEFFSRAPVARKPGSVTPGRHDERGVSWHTGGVRAHCTGAEKRGTRSNSRRIGALSMTPTLVRHHLPRSGPAPRVDPWARARDWAEIQERMLVPLYEAVYERLEVGSATRLLGLGCGSGLALLMAASRGAAVTGVEAGAPERLALARERLLPEAWGTRARAGTRLVDGEPADLATRGGDGRVQPGDGVRTGRVCGRGLRRAG